VGKAQRAHQLAPENVQVGTAHARLCPPYDFLHIRHHIRRHSGARRSREPGIHNHGRWIWIPGLALRAIPE